MDSDVDEVMSQSYNFEEGSAQNFGDLNKPYVGQIFNDLDAIYNFYNAYARKLGFGVRKNSSKISKVSGKRIWKNYVCDKAGVKFCRRINSSEEIKYLRETRSGCFAKLDVRKSDDDKWIVTNFIKEHNHELDTLRRTLKHRSHHISHKKAIAKSLMRVKEEVDSSSSPALLTDNFVHSKVIKNENKSAGRLISRLLRGRAVSRLQSPRGFPLGDITVPTFLTMLTARTCN
ncbi:Protein FAR1-RELATED SEQUENCE 5 [Platanthera zijinensis]|uniref:Protein FAR1-RELATED SEQUENCE 5 n=1 Tax=Platanthera zijinensis TaxID=2320716 RepID=A0AAP0BA15_9ASPA